MTNKTFYPLLVLALTAFWLSIISLALQIKGQSKHIHCSLSAFHPDFTPEMKKACREHFTNKPQGT